MLAEQWHWRDHPTPGHPLSFWHPAFRPLAVPTPTKGGCLTDSPDRLVNVGPLTVQPKQLPLRKVGKPASTSKLVFAAPLS